MRGLLFTLDQDKWEFRKPLYNHGGVDGRQTSNPHPSVPDYPAARIYLTTWITSYGILDELRGLKQNVFLYITHSKQLFMTFPPASIRILKSRCYSREMEPKPHTDYTDYLARSSISSIPNNKWGAIQPYGHLRQKNTWKARSRFIQDTVTPRCSRGAVQPENCIQSIYARTSPTESYIIYLYCSR